MALNLDQEAAAITARKIAHQFPTSPSAYIGLGLTTYGSLLRQSTSPSSNQQRTMLLQVHLTFLAPDKPNRSTVQTSKQLY